MSEMIERVARALAGYEYADGNDEPWEPFVGLARVAIEAMREPSEMMIAIGINQAEDCTADWTASAACVAEHVYRQMIDAALETKPHNTD